MSHLTVILIAAAAFAALFAFIELCDRLTPTADTTVAPARQEDER
jgi:hypothetical protein